MTMPASVMLASRLIAGAVHRAGEPEVEQLDAACGEEDVRGLQVAVHQSTRVNRLERRQDRGGDVDAFGERNRPDGQPFGERFAFEQFHRDEQLAVGLTDLVQLADIGMRHAGRGAGLPPEALT